MSEIANANPSLPVVTWNGSGADMPHLRHAVRRLNLGDELGVLESRHFDLFQYVSRSVRLPIPQLALAEVAAYFGIPKVSSINDGPAALSLYHEYRSSRDQERRFALKAELLEYNRDDLEALIGVAERIAALKDGWR